MYNIDKNVIFRTSFKEEDGGGQYNFVMSSIEFARVVTGLNGYTECVDPTGQYTYKGDDWTPEELSELFITGLVMKTWSDDSLSGFIVEWDFRGEKYKHYVTFKEPLRVVLDDLSYYYSCA